MSSTTKLFHPQTQGQLTKYSSNKIYNSKMSTSQNTNSNNSTSPLITRGQQLLLSSNEEDDDEDTSQIQLSTKRPSCSSQLTNSSTVNGGSNQAQHPANNFSATSNRSSLTGGTLYPSQPYSQTESQPNYYGQVMASTSATSRFLERQSSYRPQSTLGSFSTLNRTSGGQTAVEQDHHYYEPMFSSNRIYQQQSELPPLPPERNHQTALGNFNEAGGMRLQSAGNNFATLHHPQHYLLSSSVQPPHMSANYNTLNLGKHTVISNLTASSTNLQHLNQFYSKKKLHR